MLSGMTPEEIGGIQRMLIERGYLAARNAKGRPNDDGLLGAVTRAAYADYLRDLNLDAQLILPPPAKPWWLSGRGQGLIKMAVGLVLGITGTFWEPASNVNTGLLLDTVFAHLPTLLEALGIGVATWGAGQSAVGAARAQAPLTLRRPDPAPAPRDRVRPSPLPPGPVSPGQPSRLKRRDHRGHFSDDY